MDNKFDRIRITVTSLHQKLHLETSTKSHCLRDFVKLTANCTRSREGSLTTGSGASSSLHITQGTPVPNPTAIFAAQFEYA